MASEIAQLQLQELHLYTRKLQEFYCRLVLLHTDS